MRSVNILFLFVSSTSTIAVTFSRAIGPVNVQFKTNVSEILAYLFAMKVSHISQ
jgi:hypothetical protein